MIPMSETNISAQEQVQQILHEIQQLLQQQQQPYPIKTKKFRNFEIVDNSQLPKQQEQQGQQLLEQQPLQGLLQPAMQLVQGLSGAGQQGQQEQQPGLPVKQSNTR